MYILSVFGEFLAASDRIAFVAAVVAMICLVMLLLDTEFFKKDLVTADRPIAEASNSKWVNILGLLLPALFGVLTAAWAVPTGQKIMNAWVSADQIHGTNIQNANGLVFWLCGLQIFGLALWTVMNFLVLKTDKNILKGQITLPGTRMGVMLLKSLLISFTALMGVYFLVTFGEQIFAMSPRFWKVQLNSLTRLRMEKFLTYFPLYFIPFLVANYLHSTSYYLESKPVRSTVMFWLANGLPPMLFLVRAYGQIALMHTTPITSLGMSRANGSLVDAAIMMIPVGILASSLYRKTKNFYLPAIFNSMFFTWMSVATDLIFIGK